MKSHQQRVVDEKNALDEKLKALGEFFDGDIYPDLSIVDKLLLEQQYRVMAKYSEILEERIGIFSIF